MSLPVLYHSGRCIKGGCTYKLRRTLYKSEQMRNTKLERVNVVVQGIFYPALRHVRAQSLRARSGQLKVGGCERMRQLCRYRVSRRYIQLSLVWCGLNTDANHAL